MRQIKKWLAAAACFAIAGCSTQMQGVLPEAKKQVAQGAQEPKQDPKQEVKQEPKQEPVQLKESAMVENVPFIQQLPELPRGCEVTSLAMILRYHGIETDKMRLAQEIKRVPFRDEAGFIGHPNEGFVGNMYTIKESGYGVYHTPIYELAKSYAGSRAVDLTGKSSEEMYRAISQGLPVWVITNATFKLLPEERFMTWKTKQGPLRITYSEHSVAIVGYDPSFVYIHDPLAEGPTKVARAEFEQSWVQMGQQAVVVTKE